MNIMEYEETKRFILYTVIVGLMITIVGFFIFTFNNDWYGIEVSITGLVVTVIALAMDFVLDNFKELQF